MGEHEPQCPRSPLPPNRRSAPAVRDPLAGSLAASGTRRDERIAGLECNAGCEMVLLYAARG